MPKKTTLDTRLAQVEQNVIDLQYGLYKTPWGPGGISNKLIKPKTVDAGLINVDDLESVNSSTGNLDVTGTITIGQKGSLFTAGKTSYADTDPGIWFGYDTGSGTYRLNLGGTSNSLKWDSSSLTIVGSITATTGAIGGWTIGTSSLTAGSGSNTVGLDTSGGSTPAIYAGSATPSSAPFRVTQAGAVTASNVTITGGAVAGLTVDSTNGFILGSGSTTRGVSTGATSFYAGSATPSSAPFRVSSGGALVATSATITGDITTSNISATGGTVGGWTLSSSTLVGGSVTLDSTNGIIRSGATSYSSGTGWILDNNSGAPRFRVGTATSGSNYLAFDGANIEMRGKVKWGPSGGNYLDGSIAHFEIPTSAVGTGFSTIEWKNGSNTPKGFLQAFASSSLADLALGASSSGYVAYTEYSPGSSSGAALLAATNTGAGFSVTAQSIVRSTSSTSHFEVSLADTGGSSHFKVYNSSGTEVAGFASTGNPRFAASAGGGVINTSATSVSTVTAVLAVYNVSGSLEGYIPIYSSFA